MTKFKKLLAIAPVIAFLVVVTAPAGMADSFNLSIDHCSIPCAPIGTIFGTDTLTQNGTTVDVTVHLNSPFEYAKTGAADSQAFKFNATGVVLGDITVDQTVPGQTLAAETGAFNGDGTGQFTFGIECTTCGNGLSSAFSNDITFHVANAVISDLTVPNNLGFVFVADVGNPSNGNTGPIGATPATTPVPEPASIWLLGSAMVGLGFVRKRTRKN
jgi:hypothetical protein